MVALWLPSGSTSNYRPILRSIRRPPASRLLRETPPICLLPPSVRANHDSVAFRFIVANTQPVHDRIANVLRRFLPQLEKVFVQVLVLA